MNLVENLKKSKINNIGFFTLWDVLNPIKTSDDSGILVTVWPLIMETELKLLHKKLIRVKLSFINTHPKIYRQNNLMILDITERKTGCIQQLSS